MLGSLRPRQSAHSAIMPARGSWPDLLGEQRRTRPQSVGLGLGLGAAAQQREPLARDDAHERRALDDRQARHAVLVHELDGLVESDRVEARCTARACRMRLADERVARGAVRTDILVAHDARERAPPSSTSMCWMSLSKARRCARRDDGVVASAREELGTHHLGDLAGPGIVGGLHATSFTHPHRKFDAETRDVEGAAARSKRIS